MDADGCSGDRARGAPQGHRLLEGDRRSSVHATYRFTAKLRQHKGMLGSCIAAVLAYLRSEVADFGATVAIDGSDLPAYANGQRFLFNHGPERQKFSVLTLPETPFRYLDAQGRRALRVQKSRRRST